MILSSLREQFFALPEPLRRVLVFRLLSVLVSAILCLVCCFFAPGIQLGIVFSPGAFFFPIAQAATAFVCGEHARQQRRRCFADAQQPYMSRLRTKS